MYAHLTRLLLFLALTLVACGPPTQTPPPVSRAEVPAETEAPDSAPKRSCEAGVVKDDGSVETGYGFVPSAIFGEYVQQFHSDEFPSLEMESVCVCWLKTRGGRDVGFEVVFYEDAGGRPANEPYAAVLASVDVEATDVESAGKMFAVDVSPVTLVEGTSYIGVRWDPSASNYLFVCTDTSEETEVTNVFFREDRAPRWTSALNARDPIFSNHRAILLRASAESPP